MKTLNFELNDTSLTEVYVRHSLYKLFLYEPIFNLEFKISNL